MPRPSRAGIGQFVPTATLGRRGWAGDSGGGDSGSSGSGAVAIPAAADRQSDASIADHPAIAGERANEGKTELFARIPGSQRRHIARRAVGIDGHDGCQAWWLPGRTARCQGCCC